VGFSRRLRCLIKSAFLSILLVYLQLAIFVSKQALTLLFRIEGTLLQGDLWQALS
jgi:hypothetical protein